MVTPRDVEYIWGQLAGFELAPDAGEEDDLCIFARRYQGWAQEMCGPILENPSVDKIHMGMLLNTMQYYETRTILPRRHRNHVGEQGHTCVFHIAERTFHLLRMKLLSQPQHTTLLLPRPQPSPPPVAQIPALFLGDVEG